MSLEKIPTEKLIEGIKKAFENAETFLNEVYILKEYEAWAHSYAFCQLAIEELSKIPMLFKLWIDRINGNEIDYNILGQDFKNHITKAKLSVEFEMEVFRLYKKDTKADWVDDAIKKGEEYLQGIKNLNDLKNESLYVSVKDNNFQSPSDVITKEIFDEIYATALLRKMMSKNIMEASAEQIVEIAKLLKEGNKGEKEK